MDKNPELPEGLFGLVLDDFDADGNPIPEGQPPAQEPHCSTCHCFKPAKKDSLKGKKLNKLRAVK